MKMNVVSCDYLYFQQASTRHVAVSFLFLQQLPMSLEREV